MSISSSPTPRDESSQPMTPERIAVLQSNATNWLALANPGTDVEQLANHVLEATHEIERLRGWLSAINASADGFRLWRDVFAVRAMVSNALAGEAAPQ